MEQGKVHIDELFRLKAQQQPLPLPTGAWSDLKPRLDKGKPHLPFRWWYVLPLLLLLGVGFYLLKSAPSSQAISAPPKTPVAQVTAPIHTSGNPAKAASPTDNPNPAQESQSIAPKKYADSGQVQHQTTQPNEAIPANNPATVIPAKQTTKRLEAAPATRVTTVSSGKPAPGAVMQQRPNHEPASAIVITASPSSHASHANTVTATPSLAASEPQSLKSIDGQRSTAPKRKDVVPIPPLVAPVDAKVSTKAAENDITPKTFSSLSGQSAQVTPSRMSPSAPATAKAEPVDKVVASSDTVARTKPGTDNQDGQLKERPRRKQLPLSFGLKAGYEVGAGMPAINKFVAAPFLQYSFGSGFSLSLQPAIKAGTARGFTMLDGKSYYSLTGTKVDSQTISRNGRPFWQITYTHGYDSITVAYTAGTSAVEFELPLLLRYSLKNGLFFGGGPQLTFGSLIAITEQRQTAHLTQTAVFQIEKAGTHPPPDTSKSFNHTATPYASYVSQEQAAQSPLRIGYQLNAGYEYKRWLVEVGLQQTLSSLSGVTSPQVKDAYSSPYFRLLAGYRFGRK